jgi:AcrR family transcriptional regulator
MLSIHLEDFFHMDIRRPLSYACHMSTTVERPLRKDAERNRRRILDAATELFTERGLSVTLNDIAHHADVGVGTVYRRFPDKELLIDALFEERIEEMLALAEQALQASDPWQGLVGFIEQSLELQARDKGLKQLLLGTPQGCARVGGVRERMLPLVSTLVLRARDAGQLRADVEPEDLAVTQWMLGAVVDYGRDVKPELWRRYLHLLLRGLRAEPQPAEPLPVPPLTPEELDELLSSGILTQR